MTLDINVIKRSYKESNDAKLRTTVISVTDT